MINVFTNLFIGVSLGANVPGRALLCVRSGEKKMSETVHTAITFALTSGIGTVFVGLFFSRTALELMDTPADAIQQSALYPTCGFILPECRFYALQLCSCHSPCSRRYETSAFFLDDCGRNKCIAEYVFSHRSGSRSRRSRDCDRNRTDDFLYVSASCLYRSDSSYQFRFSRMGLKWIYLKQIFQVGIPAGIQKYGDQFFECPFVLRKIHSVLWQRPEAHRPQQYFWIFVSIRSFHHTGLYELYQSELQCWKVETNG